MRRYPTRAPRIIVPRDESEANITQTLQTMVVVKSEVEDEPPAERSDTRLASREGCDCQCDALRRKTSSWN